MKILIVLTSHDQAGTVRKSGFWLEELATPYFIFKEAGVDLTLASPKGGKPPIDPGSAEPAAQSDATRRFIADPEAQAALSTLRLADVRAEDFDAVFYPGGHGPVWDLAEDEHSIALIERSLALGHPVAAVCHGPAVLRHTVGADGQPLVENRSVTGFSNDEEAESGLAGVVPFLVEDMLERQGGRYTKAEKWHSHVVADGLLVTGQNPQSSGEIAQTLLSLLRARKE